MKSIKCLVSGRVQGVWFRAWTQKRAVELGVTGWVRNLADGRVETLAQGSDETLEAFKKRLWEGPHLSRVDSVECKALDTALLPDFQITG